MPAQAPTSRAGQGRRRRPAAPVIAPEPPESARAAGLRHTIDSVPGIRRLRAGKGFRYVGPDGAPVLDRSELARFRALAIPPAWTDVWICPRANGHLQATGRDARGRKQYRYHAAWREVRDESKFGRLKAFGESLPVIRARVEEDLAQNGLPREKVLAAVVRLLETTLIRVGNEEYARANASFGLTTLRDGHVEVGATRVRFAFTGKSGREHEVDFRDRRVARIVGRCRDLPGHALFQYVDEDGEPRPVDSGDVNAYLQEITGEPFTAKDFRTWFGTVLAARYLLASEAAEGDAARKSAVLRAIEAVAERLGNTPAVCRKSYIHPAVIDRYLDGTLDDLARELTYERPGTSGYPPSEDERLVMALMERSG
jgi:DNA topoisomerase-1